MSASVEALAFAGVDCNQVTVGFDSLEDDYIPPYLLVKNYENYSLSEERAFFFCIRCSMRKWIIFRPTKPLLAKDQSLIEKVVKLVNFFLL